MKDYTINTNCVQAGYTPGNGEPRQIPIYQSTTFKYDTSEDMGKLFDLEAEGYFYSRLQNPTNDLVAAKIAKLEGGTAGMLTSSGQAANFFAMFNICEAGSHIVSSSSIYGGTFNLLAVTMKKMGIDVTFVDPDCTDEELNAAFKENTRVVFGESIANPALTVLDIEKFAKAAHEHGVPLIVDNTFPTPVNLRPIEWGADIVTHSTTKYMDGHGAAVGGAIVDSGKFDWMAHADKYPGLCTPDESYHGITYAEKFGKEHKNVLQSIDNLIAENSAVKIMFKISSYKSGNGQSYRKFYMNRDGFSLLAMGFTGKEALEWKLQYIRAFNQMENFIREKSTQMWVETRKAGKLTRKAETDTIQKLVEYAKGQGSSHAEMLYMTYTRLANKMAGINKRDEATVMQLNNLSLMENIILHEVNLGIMQGKHYQEIYRDCKKRLEAVKDLAYLEAV